MALRTKPRTTEEGFGWETPYDVYFRLFNRLPKLTGTLYFFQKENREGQIMYFFEYHLAPNLPDNKELTVRATAQFDHYTLQARTAESIATEIYHSIKHQAKEQGVDVP